ncbi:Coenzyme F420 hydrogenase/dehydrogenase, beta subunit C-terminal domain [uncultured Clostridium sp.]|uniref:Coenzyme F420 hydrogenase/dehydrogenase, beta subunit C-terminal domain n=1 Tax=uncultured Clostridium sp. TaxID=59620 RepID=UPI0028EAA245|nr:Coenzyme F420 hydrogenase/dehydrogenase, beta subunit C-terminal domain [uncultured Clostridium sp.]
MNNILDSINPCTGCGACTCVCPTNAIDYNLNENGFFEAFIKNNLCIHCEKCKEVCVKFLVEEREGRKLREGVVYSAQSTNQEVVSTCTSGGIAYEISKHGIENGYKIVGVIYDYNDNIAKTVVIDNLEELERIKGSKYLQSNTEEAFREVISLSRKDRECKFIIFGTPCQIFGIKKAFEVNSISNELITIDLFCHGVPSYLVWQEYLKWLENKHEIKSISKINFRSKYIGWHDFTMEICSHGEDYYYPSEYDLFFKSFFDNILLNTSCFNCITRREKSLADIRLGDFWGWRYQDRQDGVSAVVVLSDVGQTVLDELIKLEKVKIIDKEISIEECTERQSIHPYKNISLQKDAFSNLKSGKSLSYTIKSYRKEFETKKRIKIFLKESTSYLPDRWRSNLRKWYGKK